MAWFSKPKHLGPVTPGLCARCRKRQGSTRFHFAPGPGVPPLAPSARSAWLCDVCADAVRRAAGNN